MAKSVLAGMFIAIGCIVNTRVGGIAGSVLFSLGLMAIILMDLNLFTGKVGFAKMSLDCFRNLTNIWFGNIFGITLVTMMLKITRISVDASSIAAPKASDSMLSLLVLGMPCGILMYTAVRCYVNSKNIIPVVFCVAVFILCGFEHCIADTFYVENGNISVYNALRIVLASTVGNAIGGILTHRIVESK